MATLRAQLVEQLQALLGEDWFIVPTPTVPDSVNRPTLVVYRGKVEPLGSAPRAQYRSGFVVWVLIDPEQSEDLLDDRLETVGGALEDIAWAFQWTATRDVFEERWPAYRLEFDVHSNKTTTTEE